MKAKHTKRPSKIEPELSSEVSSSFIEQPFDIMIHAWWSHFIGWLSPVSFSMAFSDWLAHLAFSPAKQTILSQAAIVKLFAFMHSFDVFRSSEFHPGTITRPSDKRFNYSLWQLYPFNQYAYGFLLLEDWWQDATSSIRGVSSHHQQIVNFQSRQFLDIFSPSNFPMTNPEVLQRTLQTSGMNFVAGLSNFCEDFYRFINQLPQVGTEQFKVGFNLAITPGKVIYKNDLIELIQYVPTTSHVYKEPILIIPAWIMKYYILDLSPHNSLVKYLVAHGHTVFMISWKNPGSHDRDLGLEDYLNLGILEALDVITKIIPAKQVHTVGYCIGGTLLMICAALLASQSDNRIKSITTFAAQVDFKEPSEISVFIDQSQITYLEDIMWEKGYLDGTQMSGTFSMLHSNDLIWSRIIHDYLLGQRRPIIDLVAWDLDTTRLPYQMHSEYLHKLCLNNDLSRGRFKVGKQKIALPNIKAPIFCVGTLTDHISPWKSVYNVHLFCDTDIIFVLTSGGHNAGIISEPGHLGRSYQMLMHVGDDKYISAENWQADAPHYQGSWWPAWQSWLVSHSSKQVSVPSLGNSRKGFPVLYDAPGHYVLT